MHVETQSARTIFLHAVEHHRPDQWPAFLDKACRDNSDLRREVLRLLDAHAQLENFMARPAAGEAVTVDQAPLDIIGGMIGRYKLMEQIGEGGMGIVYVAEQTEPVRRKVALKIIKPGLDSRQVIARFEAERQALALMDHSNIAKVLDAGATATTDGGYPGRPYFVMELVRGLPITEYCDKARLQPRQRLELFITVCQAVQHAHQKGIIHRDLKPSNVLVTLHDGTPVPKVIDFGVAKALNQQLSEHTIYTAFSQMIGTPLYMSPEQAEMSNLDVDTRSDVYSLGVLLYELLTGSTPFDSQMLKNASFDEMRRIIREDEPPRPSQRVSTLRAEAISTLSQRRGIDERRLAQTLRGELDWIVMKALEKDRTRRYESPSALAADIERFLRDQAVEACPPSALYRFRKLVRRHKVAFGISAFVTSLLLVTAIGGSVLATWALNSEAASRRNESLAKSNESLAKSNEALAKKNESAAKTESDRAKVAEVRAKAVLDFFAGKVLAAGFPEGHGGGLGKDVTLRAVVDAAEPQIAESFSAQPLTEASIRSVLGKSYLLLGEPERAVAQYQRSLEIYRREFGPKHRATLTAMHDLAIGHRDLWELDKATALLEETAELQEAQFGRDDPDSLKSLSSLGVVYHRAGKLDKAFKLYQETFELRKRRLGSEHDETLTSMLNLATIYSEQHQFDKALPLVKQVYELRMARLGPNDRSTIASAAHLGSVLVGADQVFEGLPLLETVYNVRKERLGSEHPDTLHVMGSLGHAYLNAGEHGKALPLLEVAYRGQTTKLGPTHQYTMQIGGNLAGAYLDTMQIDKALPLAEELLKLMQSTFGPVHPSTIAMLNTLSAIYGASGKPEKSLALLEEAYKLQTEKLGRDDPSTLQTMSNLGIVIWNAGRREEALPYYEHALQLSKARLGPSHRDTLFRMGALGRAMHGLGRANEARKLLEEAVQLESANLGAEHPDTLRETSSLALVYVELGDWDRAIPMLEGQRSRYLSKYGTNDVRTIRAGSALAHAYAKSGNAKQAAPLLEEVVAWNKSNRGTDHSDTLESMNQLGNTLSAAGQHAKAVTVLEEALPLTTERFGPDHIYTLMNMDALARANRDSGDNAQAVRLWEKVLAARRKLPGPNHPLTLTTGSNLGAAYKDLGELDKAIPLIQEMLDASRAQFGPDHADTLTNMNNLASGYLDAQRYEEAIAVFQETLELRMANSNIGPEHASTVNTQVNLAAAFRESGRLEKAATLLEETLELQMKKLGREDPQVLGTQSQLGLTFLRQRDYDRVESLLRECLAACEKTQPNLWTTFSRKSMLGEALLGQARKLKATDPAAAEKKMIEAESLLLAGYEGMKAREEKIPASGKIRLNEAIQRLIDLYSELEKSDEAARWRLLLPMPARDSPPVAKDDAGKMP